MYDDDWSMPLPNWQPTGSFIRAATPPVGGPIDGDLVQLPCINVDWLPLVLGALDQLRNPSTWLDTLSDSALESVLDRANYLRSLVAGAVNVPCCNVAMRLNSSCTLQFSTDGGSTWNDVTDWNANFDSCVKAHVPPQVPVPVNPGNPEDNACAIAEWLTEQLWIIAGQKLHDALNAGERVDQFINDLVTQIAAFAPILDVIVGPFQAMYTTQLPEPLANLQTALSDTTFEADVRCAIYSAISGVGYVNFTNFSGVVTAIGAISYTYSYIPTMLANLFNSLGLPAIQALQAVNPITAADCTSCGQTWCHYFDFSVSDGGWLTTGFSGFFGNYVPGVGWEGVNIGANYNGVQIYFDLGAAHNITEVQVNLTSNGGSTSGQPHLVGTTNAPGSSYVWSASTPFPANAPAYAWQSGTGSGSARYAVAAYVSAPSTATTIIAGIQLRGTGPSPFSGGSNCIVGP